MFCPNCGKDCGEAKFCSVCGQELSVEQTISQPPVGRYEAVDGYIDVSDYTMTIHKVIGTQSVESVIDYNDITDVIFREAHTSNGFLAIREEKDRLPPIKDEWDAVCDEKTSLFGVGEDQEFHTLYTFLNHCKAITQARIRKRMEMRRYCPKCKSSDISEHYMLVPVVVRMKDHYVCHSCGHLWTVR